MNTNQGNINRKNPPRSEVAIALWNQYKETFTYIVFGLLTTAVDFSVYWLLSRLFGMDKVASQIISVAMAILFAFITNKRFVFCDRTTTFEALLVQFTFFLSMRLVSSVIQIGALWLFAEALGWYDFAVKIVVTVIITVLNYIFSKLLIFTKKAPETGK